MGGLFFQNQKDKLKGKSKRQILKYNPKYKSKRQIQKANPKGKSKYKIQKTKGRKQKTIPYIKRGL